jgi:hypothetical protein
MRLGVAVIEPPRRSSMPAREKDQLALDERFVNDAELEAALERRLRAADDRAEVGAVYKQADKEVKAQLERLEPAVSVDMPVRVGRFRITINEIASRHVSFTTEPSERLSIALVEES